MVGLNGIGVLPRQTLRPSSTSCRRLGLLISRVLHLLGDGVVVPRVPGLVVQTSPRLTEYPSDVLVHFICNLIPYLRSHSHFPDAFAAA